MTIFFSAAEKLYLTPEAVLGCYCLVQQFSAIKKLCSCLEYGCLSFWEINILKF